MADTVSDPEQLLSRFGLTCFRPGQREVIDAVLGGQDVLCVMPTGGGKSLCYQLPSLARGGTTIVVSPLIALMKDQIDTLRGHGINARLINSSLTLGEQESVMREMSEGTVPMVYVAPERLRNGRFLEAVAKANVTLLAVDEAHCVSEWGHDFRPDYARLGHFRERYLRNVQTIALTATATPTVRDDVCQLLGLNAPSTFVTGFARENLRFGAETCGADRAKDERLADYLRGQTGSGIIYAATRKRCEELAAGLSRRAGRAIGVYHAGMPPDERRRVQEAFMGGELTAIVATNAFGMGIDKSDIRFVVHYNIPGSLEAYYQEAGRAGRDGEASDCLLLFSYQDRYVQEYFIENRYPSRETVRKVYEFLTSREEDPIELTLEQVRDAIGIKEGSESVGTSETLLARAGVLKRLDSNANQAIVRIDSDAPTMLDFLPREAKRRRSVMAAVEKIVGSRRGEDVYFRPTRLAEMAGMERDQLSRVLRELQRLKAFDYVPPFRGRAVHILERDVSFDALEIDFDELARRKAAEYEKLESVIAFARAAGCRQRVILDYFGDPNRGDCGNCDRCQVSGAAGAGSAASGVEIAGTRRGNEVGVVASGGVVEGGPGVDSDELRRGLLIVLSGVARMHGRFGKNLVAQMLCGSKNKKLQQWKLHRLSTYGLLGSLSQSQVTAVIDAAVSCGLIEQKEVDERRPTVQLSELGKRVMKATEEVPPSFRLPYPLAKRLAMAARTVDPVGGAVAGDAAASVGGVASGGGGETAADVGGAAGRPGSPLEEELKTRLVRFRRKRSAALDVPAYRILTNATIARLIEMRPRTVTELEAVSGIGPATIEQFGHDLVELIVEACSEGGAGEGGAAAERDAGDATDLGVGVGVGGDSRAAGGPGVAGEPESDRGVTGGVPVTEGVAASGYWTWRLFRDGYSAEQIAEIRGVDRGRLVEDLVAAAKAGHAVDPGWVTDPEGRGRLEDLRVAATRLRSR